MAIGPNSSDLFARPGHGDGAFPAYPTQGGSAPAIHKAEVPWSARRRDFTEQEHILRKVRGILNKLTPDNFDILKEELIYSGIRTDDILKGVVSLIYDKAVLEPIFCPLYAHLCSDLSWVFPPFPPDNITFKCILVTKCQQAFEGADRLRDEVRQRTVLQYRDEEERLLKLRTLGNMRLIGELYKQKVLPEKIIPNILQVLLGHDTKACPKEENVEAICLFFNTVGRQVDENLKSKCEIDRYFSRLKELTTDPHLALRLRFMILDVLDLRANNWVPKHEELKPKTIEEIHQEEQKRLGSHPGGRARRYSRGAASRSQMVVRRRDVSLSRPDSGGVTLGVPGIDAPDNGDVEDYSGSWSTASFSRALPQVQLSPTSSAPQFIDTPTCPLRLDPDQHRATTMTLLDRVQLLDEAIRSVEELNSRVSHSEFVMGTISVGLETDPPHRYQQVTTLLEYLFAKKILTTRDIEVGCLRYATLLDSVGIRLPLAPIYFGEMVANLVLAGMLNFKIVKEILLKVVDESFQEAIFKTIIEIFTTSPSGQQVLDSQASDIADCTRLFPLILK